MISSKEWTQLLESENGSEISKQVRTIGDGKSKEEILSQVRDLMHAWDKYYPFTKNTEVSERLISELLNLTKKDTSLKPDMYCNISAIYSRKLAAEADNASNDYKAGSFEGIALGYFKMAANLSDGRLYGDNRYKTYADLLDQHKRMVLRSAKAMPAEYANDYARGVLDGLTIIAGTYKEQGDELVEFRDEYVSYLQEKGLDVLPNSKVSKALLGASGTKLKSELLKSVILSDKVHH